MGGKTDNRSPGNSVRRDASKHHVAPMPEATFRPSNLFLSASASPSCRSIRADKCRPRRGTATAILQLALLENSDEHRRNILQEIFRLGVLEKGGVLFQFVCHLINDETAAGRERIMCFLQKRAFLIDLENTKRDAGKNVIAFGNAAALQFAGQRGRIAMDHVQTWIAGKLPFKVACERRIELEQEQMRIRAHSSRDLARMHAFTWTVLRDHAGLAEIHFAGDAFHQRFRAGDDRRNLKWPLQEALEKQHTHETRTLALRFRVVQS